jgi:hypothetical protein
MFNTNKSRNRDEALDNIIKQISTFTSTVAYFCYGNNCCCCYPFECIYIIYKHGYEFHILYYYPKYTHEKTCTTINQCNCDYPFEWRNILPTEIDLKYLKNENIGIDSFTFLYKHENIEEEMEEYYIQQEENNAINEYNEKEDNENNKNYSYYF